MKFPTLAEVAAELRNVNDNVDGVEGGVDVRLQVTEDGEWLIHSGDSSYDQDHRGFWGSASVPGGGRRFASMDVAREVLEQARDQHAQVAA